MVSRDESTLEPLHAPLHIPALPRREEVPTTTLDEGLPTGAIVIDLVGGSDEDDAP